jgi:cobalamin biosynthetic protein CobC
MGKREHGGNLDDAVAKYGGCRADWLDLSTGINPVPWPVPAIRAEAWTRLPESRRVESLLDAARTCYGVADENDIVAGPGVQAFIQVLPLLAKTGSVKIVNPTYNEYSTSFRNHDEINVQEFSKLTPDNDASTVVLVNPNNPDGRRHEPGTLLALAGSAALLVVDEAFADTDPDLSLCGHVLPRNVVVLRSFGKFFGLAGVRLGFAIAHSDICARLAALLGPWAVSGPAIQIGTDALSDADWIAATRGKLNNEMSRLHDLLDAAGAEIVGGTDLFVTVRVSGVKSLMNRLGAERIWVRAFSYEPQWLRFGLPGDEPAWGRLARALAAD